MSAPGPMPLPRGTRIQARLCGAMHAFPGGPSVRSVALAISPRRLRNVELTCACRVLLLPPWRACVGLSTRSSTHEYRSAFRDWSLSDWRRPFGCACRASDGGRQGHAGSDLRNAVARFDQVIEVADEDRDLAFSNIQKAARHSMQALGKVVARSGHPPAERKKSVARCAVT